MKKILVCILAIAAISTNCFASITKGTAKTSSLNDSVAHISGGFAADGLFHITADSSEEISITLGEARIDQGFISYQAFYPWAYIDLAYASNF